MAEVPPHMGTEFDIFAPKPRQVTVEGTTETIYKLIASFDESDIQFLIPGDSETYIDLDLKFHIMGKLLKEDNTKLGDTDYTAGINNLLHSLFSQCSISLNGTQITQATELYNYRAYLETLLTYGSDADESHLKNALSHLDTCNMKGDDTTKPNETTNDGFVQGWNRMKKARQQKCTDEFILISATFRFIS